MSKNRKKQSYREIPRGDQVYASPIGTDEASLEEEYKTIKLDLVKVLLINIIFLALMLAIYYTNNGSHYLERWFSNI